MRWQGYALDDTDNGVLCRRTVTDSKKAPGTGLRVLWSDNFRVYNSSTACRWEVVFNGVSCTSPGGIFFDKYEGNTASNRHDMATVMGACYGLPPGPVAVSTPVGPTTSYSGHGGTSPNPTPVVPTLEPALPAAPSQQHLQRRLAPLPGALGVLLVVFSAPRPWWYGSADGVVAG